MIYGKDGMIYKKEGIIIGIILLIILSLNIISAFNLNKNKISCRDIYGAVSNLCTITPGNGSDGGNSSWNQSYANTLYISKSSESELISGNVVSGQNTFTWSLIPSCASDSQLLFRPKAKSTTGTDDPVFESADLWMR